MQRMESVVQVDQLKGCKGFSFMHETGEDEIKTAGRGCKTPERYDHPPFLLAHAVYSLNGRALERAKKVPSLQLQFPDQIE